jgi:prepilin peptidase CpaA
MTAFELIPAAVASVAALIDIRWRRIPNWLTLAALVGGLAVHVLRLGVAGVPIALGGAALGLCLLLPFYLIRAVGAGDVKLLAGLGALLGPAALVSVVIYGGLVGGVISVVMLARRHELQRSVSDILHNPFNLRRGGAKAPYGVAIASGVYLSMLLPSVIG